MERCRNHPKPVSLAAPSAIGVARDLRVIRRGCVCLFSPGERAVRSMKGLVLGSATLLAAWLPLAGQDKDTVQAKPAHQSFAPKPVTRALAERAKRPANARTFATNKQARLLQKTRPYDLFRTPE